MQSEVNVILGTVVALLAWALTVSRQRLGRAALIERVVLVQRRTIRELLAQLGP